MKNLYILPTDKDSNLFIGDLSGQLHFNYSIEKGSSRNQHIYLTSEGEIKEGDWFIRDGSIHKCFRVHKTDIEFLTSIDSVYCGSNTFWSKEFCKKIILTTDQDLIKDGVQAIPDEFIEWFVQNPSCKFVEVKKGEMKLNDDGEEYGFPDMSLYKIIIPKEPKQEMPIVNGSYGCTIQTKRIETLEEAAECKSHHSEEDFIRGAKWQQERSYSELELFINEVKDKIDSFEYSVNQKSYISEYLDEWFEQFKKK